MLEPDPEPEKTEYKDIYDASGKIKIKFSAY